MQTCLRSSWKVNCSPVLGGLGRGSSMPSSIYVRIMEETGREGLSIHFLLSSSLTAMVRACLVTMDQPWGTRLLCTPWRCTIGLCESFIFRFTVWCVLAKGYPGRSEHWNAPPRPPFRNKDPSSPAAGRLPADSSQLLASLGITSAEKKCLAQSYTPFLGRPTSSDSLTEPVTQMGQLWGAIPGSEFSAGWLELLWRLNHSHLSICPILFSSLPVLPQVRYRSTSWRSCMFVSISESASWGKPMSKHWYLLRCIEINSTQNFIENSFLAMIQFLERLLIDGC